MGRKYKQMKKKLIVLAAFVCSACAFCASCARQPAGEGPADNQLTGAESKLIGRWVRLENLQLDLFGIVADSIEFKEDGTCYFDGIKMEYRVFTGRMAAADETEYEILSVEWTDESGLERKAEFEIGWDPLSLAGEVPDVLRGGSQFCASFFTKL